MTDAMHTAGRVYRITAYPCTAGRAGRAHGQVATY